MLFDKLRSLRRTLAFRLTVWYAAIFTASSLLAFFFFYLQIASILRERTDEELLDDIEEFSALFGEKGVDEVKQTMILEAKNDGEKEVFYRLLSTDGKELGSSELFSWGQLSVSQPALQQLAKDAKPVFETLAIEGRRHLARSVYAPIGPGTILQIGISLEDDDEFLAAIPADLRRHNHFSDGFGRPARLVHGQTRADECRGSHSNSPRNIGKRSRAARSGYGPDGRNRQAGDDFQ